MLLEEESSLPATSTMYPEGEIRYHSLREDQPPGSVCTVDPKGGDGLQVTRGPTAAGTSRGTYVSRPGARQHCKLLKILARSGHPPQAHRAFRQHSTLTGKSLLVSLAFPADGPHLTPLSLTPTEALLEVCHLDITDGKAS